MRTISVSKLLAAVLALLYPVLTVRMFGHTALAGNWLILLGLCKAQLMPTCLQILLLLHLLSWH